MEDRDQNIANILKHIKGLRKDIREIRKSMDSASKMVYTNQEIMEQLDVSTAVLKNGETPASSATHKTTTNTTTPATTFSNSCKPPTTRPL